MTKEYGETRFHQLVPPSGQGYESHLQMQAWSIAKDYGFKWGIGAVTGGTSLFI